VKTLLATSRTAAELLVRHLQIGHRTKQLAMPTTHGLEKGNHIADLRERLNKRKPVSTQIDSAYLVREERASL